MGTENPLRWIRREVFAATQDEMAVIGGVSRPRISRYETQDPPPFDYLQRVRDEALRRGVAFSGDWFFEVPQRADASADEGTGQ